MWGLSGHRSPAAPCTAVIRRHCLSGTIGYVSEVMVALPFHGMHIVLLGAFCILHSDQDESFRFDYFFRFPRVSLRSALGYTLMNPFGFGFSVHRVSLQSRASKADNAPLGARKIILPVHGYKPVCQNNIRQFLND